MTQRSISKHYIAGQWVAAASAERIPVVNPATEQVIASSPAGTVDETDRAIAAAADAFPAWSALPASTRATYLREIAAGLTARLDEVARTLTSEMGGPISETTGFQAPAGPAYFSAAADIAESFDYEYRDGNATIVREPFGVVAAITPWNFPFLQVSGKTAAAIGAGNTVVVKPSEVAPLTAQILAEVIDAVGLPAGVFNLVFGTGPVVGERLVSHPLVDKVTFTGSTRSGRRISELAADTVKKVSLELGGKSAGIILADADVEQAVTAGVAACFVNSGQQCTAITRLLVPRSELAVAEAAARRAVDTYVVGDPSKETTRIGPMVSAVQQQRVKELIVAGVQEGARLVAGGSDTPEGLGVGFYVRPTVFSNVRPGMRIEQEEIFGPVLVLVPYDGEDEAVRIANDSIYGLSGAVWSADREHAQQIAKRMRTGQVSINGGRGTLTTPFGGYKQSGLGREQGSVGFSEFLELKAVY